MTVATTDNAEQYAGDSSTVSFSLPVLVYDQDHVVVTLTDSDGVDHAKALTTDFSVSGTGSGSGITVTMVTAPDTGEVLTIERVVPLTQEADYVANDTFPAESHEQQLDLLMMAIQQVNDLAQRCLHFPASLRSYDTELAALQAGKFWRTNLAGTGIEQVDTVASNGVFTQSGTGAVERTVDAKLGDEVTLWDFDVDPTGVADSTAGLTAAITYCLSTGRRLRIPAGIYSVTQLSITVDTSIVGPLTIVGDGCQQLPGVTRGTIIKQIAGTTGTLLTVTGNWASPANDPIIALRIDGIGFQTASACTGWAIDMFNVTNVHSELSNLVVYVPGSSSAGGIRQRSCWMQTLRNIRGIGPSAGTTAKGLVIYGDASTGTTNQTVLQNINMTGFSKANVQIGKWDESGGGTTQGIVWVVGQCGTAAGYGVVIGRVFDLTIMGVHTENHDKSGWLITQSANGADSGYIKLIQCDSYGDGVNGAGTADADTYTIQVKRTNLLHIDGFRMQEACCGIWVDDTSQATNIEIDRVSFGGASGLNPDISDSETILYIANATGDTDKRVTLGNYTVAYTWGNNGANIIENPNSISYKSRTDADAQRTTTTGTETILPWTQEVSLAPTSFGISGAANNGSGLIRISPSSSPGLTTGDVVRVWGVVGTIEANGVWTVTVSSITSNATTSAGSAVITGITDTSSMTVGMTVISSKIPAGRTIASIDSATQVTLNSGTDVTSGTVSTEFVSVDLQGSTFTNAYGANSFDRCGKIRELTDFVAPTNYAIAQGQLLTVNLGGGNLKFVDVDNGGNFYLKDGRDYIPDIRDTVVFHRRGTAWYEISRSMARSYMQDNGGNDETLTVREYGTATSITINNLTQTVVLAHSAATNLNTLGDASGRETLECQVVRLRATNGNTTVKDASGGGSAKFRLAGGADLTLGNRDTLTVMKVGTEWHELSRSNN